MSKVDRFRRIVRFPRLPWRSHHRNQRWRRAHLNRAQNFEAVALISRYAAVSNLVGRRDCSYHFRLYLSSLNCQLGTPDSVAAHCAHPMRGGTLAQPPWCIVPRMEPLSALPAIYRPLPHQVWLCCMTEWNESQRQFRKTATLEKIGRLPDDFLKSGSSKDRRLRQRREHHRAGVMQTGAACLACSKCRARSSVDDDTE